MGFERIGKRITLQFDNPAYAGLEVRMRSLSTDRFLEVTELAATVQSKSFTEAAAEFRKIMDLTAASMQSWNLEDDGVPVPATLAGLLDQEFEFVFDIVMAWLTAIAGVAPPLPASSNGGGRSPGLSIPMEPLSPSLSS